MGGLDHLSFTSPLSFPTLTGRGGRSLFNLVQLSRKMLVVILHQALSLICGRPSVTPGGLLLVPGQC